MREPAADIRAAGMSLLRMDSGYRIFPVRLEEPDALKVHAMATSQSRWAPGGALRLVADGALVGAPGPVRLEGSCAAT